MIYVPKKVSYVLPTQTLAKNMPDVVNVDALVLPNPVSNSNNNVNCVNEEALNLSMVISSPLGMRTKSLNNPVHVNSLMDNQDVLNDISVLISSKMLCEVSNSGNICSNVLNVHNEFVINKNSFEALNEIEEIEKELENDAILKTYFPFSGDNSCPLNTDTNNLINQNEDMN